MNKIQDVMVHLDHPELVEVCRAGLRRCAEVALAAWRGARGIKHFLDQYQHESEIYALLLQQIEAVSLENDKVKSFRGSQILLNHWYESFNL